MDSRTFDSAIQTSVIAHDFSPCVPGIDDDSTFCFIRQIFYGEISVVYLIDVAHPFKTGLDYQTWQAYNYVSVNQVISGSAYV